MEFQKEAEEELERPRGPGASHASEEQKVLNHRSIRPPSYVCPSVSWYTGADILDLVGHAEGPVPVLNYLDVITDGLFCEWAYVVDLDAGALEVYVGNDEGKDAAPTRFHDLECVKAEDEPMLVGSWKFSELPSTTAFADHCCAPGQRGR